METILSLILLSAAFSLVIGLCFGFLIGRRLGQRRNEDAETIAETRQELNGWKQWYSTHLPACALLEESNRAGREVLREWEDEQ
jgi:hypothetical protein